MAEPEVSPTVKVHTLLRMTAGSCPVTIPL